MSDMGCEGRYIYYVLDLRLRVYRKRVERLV